MQRKGPCTTPTCHSALHCLVSACSLANLGCEFLKSQVYS